MQKTIAWPLGLLANVNVQNSDVNLTDLTFEWWAPHGRCPRCLPANALLLGGYLRRGHCICLSLTPGQIGRHWSPVESLQNIQTSIYFEHEANRVQRLGP
jgi:hypothetical protein